MKDTNWMYGIEIPPEDPRRWNEGIKYSNPQYIESVKSVDDSIKKMSKSYRTAIDLYREGWEEESFKRYELEAKLILSRRLTALWFITSILWASAFAVSVVW